MVKIVDVSKLTSEALGAIVVSHRRTGRTSSSLYLAAMREMEIRTSHGLDFDRSFRVIQRRAEERRPVSYKDVADASGADWSEVYSHIDGHLSRLAVYARGRGWPTPSVIVIKENLAGSGKPEPADGFLEAAKALGAADPSESPFLREQEEKLFKWSQAPKE